MTDYSSWTDEQVNEAVFKAKGWVEVIPNILWTRGSDRVDIENTREIPDYTHSWDLCGELITEMGDAISDGWELSCEHSDMDELEPLKWRVWMTRFTNDPADFRSVCGEADTPIRAFDICWLAWKEQG